MDIPRKLKAGGHRLPVKRHDDNQNYQLGFYDPDLSHISLNDSERVMEDIQAETFMHEIFEVICHIYNIDIPHEVLTLQSEVLFAIIRDNNLDFRKP